METLYQDNKDDGLMVLTVLTEDGDRNVPDAADCTEWASAYGATHPILGDTNGFVEAVMSEGLRYPFSMLIDRGMVVTTTDTDTRSISEAEMHELMY